jgi:hypothetical protein
MLIWKDFHDANEVTARHKQATLFSFITLEDQVNEAICQL